MLSSAAVVGLLGGRRGPAAGRVCSRPLVRHQEAFRPVRRRVAVRSL